MQAQAVQPYYHVCEFVFEPEMAFPLRQAYDMNGSTLLGQETDFGLVATPTVTVTIVGKFTPNVTTPISTSGPGADLKIWGSISKSFSIIITKTLVELALLTLSAIYHVIYTPLQ